METKPWLMPTWLSKMEWAAEAIHQPAFHLVAKGEYHGMPIPALRELKVRMSGEIFVDVRIDHGGRKVRRGASVITQSALLEAIRKSALKVSGVYCLRSNSNNSPVARPSTATP